VIVLGLACGQPLTAQESGSSDTQKRFSVETSVLDPLFSIYFARLYYRVGSRDELGLGAYCLWADATFSAVPYPGPYRNLSLLIDYRRDLGSQWYVEYQAMPSYVVYLDSGIGTEGFELWNEIHIGYEINFSIGRASLFISPQVTLGFCLYKGNEPSSFRTAEETNPAFFFPNFYVLPNILLGIKL
jgi:hypothetical protein